MNAPKVLLAALEERTSASGTRYLSGWLGKARVVGFLDRDAADEKTVWNVYVQEPQPREDQAGGRGTAPRHDGGRRQDRQRHEPLPDVARRAAGERQF